MKKSNKERCKLNIRLRPLLMAKRRWLSGCLTALTLAAAGTIHAAMVTELLETAPAEGVIRSYYVPDSPANSRSWTRTTGGSSPRTDVAASFSIDRNATLTAITFVITNSNAMLDERPFTVSIYEYIAGSEPATPDSGTFLGTQAGTMMLTEGSAGFLRMQFEDDLSLKADHFYTFVLQWADDNSGNRVIFKRGDYNGEISPYNWDRQGGSSWVRRTTAGSIYFFAEGSFEPIPEPSVALLVLPIVGFAAWRGWRKGIPKREAR